MCVFVGGGEQTHHYSLLHRLAKCNGCFGIWRDGILRIEDVVEREQWKM